MKLKALKTIQDLEFLLAKLQSNIVDFLNQLTSNPFLVGTIIDIDILTTDTTLNHGLGVEPTGWIILDKNANANIWKVSQDKNQIILKSSLNATCKVWVF